jgi:acyl-coenzyme A thioesterase PaaI-like protein
MFDLKKLPLKTVARFMNFYPPYLGAGVKIKLENEDKLIFNVSMPLKITNRNYVGVHFGGSLYSMVDPFYMLILMNKLGKDYLVWDKKAAIHFKRPGTGTVSARFEISDERVKEIKESVEKHGKWEPEFVVEVVDENKNVVCTVNKTLWVKKKS